MATRPSKIVCVGRSYADHAKELGTPYLTVRYYLSSRQAAWLDLNRELAGIRHGATVIMNVNSVYV